MTECLCVGRVGHIDGWLHIYLENIEKAILDVETDSQVPSSEKGFDRCYLWELLSGVHTSFGARIMDCRR